ncbi:hypothetical protein T492DRAFT_865848 [Pavlovales sp. CCMP2436]|nr:hypothetical protein T492DRAFT_865848 [Pavlovales sp. CCMP2436]
MTIPRIGLTESDDPDKLPTRYAVSGVQYAFKKFESSNNNERVLCPICLKKRRATGVPHIVDFDEDDE